MKELRSLRDAVIEVDSEIIALIARRMEITARIGEMKKREGIPLANWQVEKEVIGQASLTAGALGVDRDLAVSIMQQLISGSRIRQEMLHYSGYRGDRERILVIGGLGEMGTWFSRFFQNQGHKVSIFDLQGSSQEFTSYVRLADGLEDVSCAFIAVSLEVVPAVIEELVRLKFGGVIIDIASLKGHLCSSIEKARKQGAHIVSIHPMFGPNTRTLGGKTLCLCDCNDQTANDLVTKLFGETALSIVRVSLREHDRMVSYILGLSHIMNIAFMKVLLISGFPYRELEKVASTTFLAQMETAASVINENPELYYAIQHFNPFRDKLYGEVTDSLEELFGQIKRGEKGEFAGIMEQGKRWLEE